MVLFGKREVAFQVQGDKARWKAAREALKAAGVEIMESGSYEGETPLCGCGAKIDRRIYYVSVRPGDVERAKAVLADV